MAVTPKQAKTQAMIDDVLEIYPEKARKDRVKHVKPNDPDGSKECMVKSNIKSRPGVMTIRGCAYAGSKGVVWGRSRTWSTSATDRWVAASTRGARGATTSRAPSASTASSRCSSPATSPSATSCSAVTRNWRSSARRSPSSSRSQRESRSSPSARLGWSGSRPPEHR